MNLEEVARLSGVSRSTVSRVINNDRNVSAITRERVLTVIRQVNFQPNMAARSLAAGHTRIIGLVIPMGVATLFVDPYFPILIQGVASACNSLDHSVMLWLAEAEYERRTIQQVMHNGLVDGVIIASMLMDDPLVQALRASRLPYLLVGRHPSDAQANYIDVDNRNSTREAVLHLIRLGRRRIGTVTGPLNMIAGADRLAGYEDALRAKGLPIDPGLIVEGDFTEGGGYDGMQQLLLSRPDAVFVASDTMTVGALRALRGAGLRVPDDIALVSFDDMPFAARTDPPLTTVRQPVHRMGMAAAETLIDIIANPGTAPRRIIFPTELVIRSSCGSGR